MQDFYFQQRILQYGITTFTEVLLPLHVSCDTDELR